MNQTRRPWHSRQMKRLGPLQPSAIFSFVFHLFLSPFFFPTLCVYLFFHLLLSTLRRCAFFFLPPVLNNYTARAPIPILHLYKAVYTPAATSCPRRPTLRAGTESYSYSCTPWRRCPKAMYISFIRRALYFPYRDGKASQRMAGTLWAIKGIAVWWMLSVAPSGGASILINTDLTRCGS